MSNSEQQREFWIYCRPYQQWFHSQGGYTYHSCQIHGITHQGHPSLEDEGLISSKEDFSPSDHLQHGDEWPLEPLSSSLSPQINMYNTDLNSGPEHLLLGTRELVDEVPAFDVNVEAFDEGNLRQQLSLTLELLGSDSGEAQGNDAIPHSRFIEWHPTINGTWSFIHTAAPKLQAD